MAFCTSCNVPIAKEKHDCEDCGEPLCESCHADGEGFCKECKESTDSTTDDDEMLESIENIFSDDSED